MAVDCRITDTQQGIGTAVQVFAKALSESKIEAQHYTFIVRESMLPWLSPYVYGPCSIVGIADSKFSPAKKILRSIAPLRFLWDKFRNMTAPMPVSDGYVEAQRFDVVHFPTQAGFLTTLPTIYQPWDLQHLHYPEFFSKSLFAQREERYRALCAQATCVCVQAEWTRQDVIRQYRLAEEKVTVIPWGSVLDAYKTPSADEVPATIAKYQLPEQFFFYPAATWPHKNHAVILHALHLLKQDCGIAPHVFFTGASTENRATIDLLAEELGVSGQLHFLGFVSPGELQSIYKAATAMIFASKFEGFGLPILEAFHARLPVLSSSATTLPEVGQDGALYFDADRPAELAALMKRILDEPELGAALTQNGSRILAKHSILDTAAAFQKLYAKVAAASSQE